MFGSPSTNIGLSKPDAVLLSHQRLELQIAQDREMVGGVLAPFVGGDDRCARAREVGRHEHPVDALSALIGTSPSVVGPDLISLSHVGLVPRVEQSHGLSFP